MSVSSGTLLPSSRPGEHGLVDPDTDGPPAGSVCARLAQRAIGAGIGEVRDPGPVGASPDGHDHAVGAGHRVVAEIDPELVFAEPALGRRRRLGSTARVDVFVLEQLLELTAAVHGVAIHGGVVGLAAGVVARRSSMRVSATAPSPALPGVTVVSVMISESGSSAMCPL